MKISRNDIFLIALVVLLTLKIDSILTKPQKPDQMIRNEERLKSLEAQRKTDSVTLVETREKYDSLILASLQRVNVLETQKQPIKNVIKNIPAVVTNLDKEQLRDGAIRYDLPPR